MRQIDIHAAEMQLSSLVEQAAQGEPFIIARAGRPLVKVVPVEPAPQPSLPRIGFLRDADWRVPDDFDTMMQDEIIQMFEGED